MKLYKRGKRNTLVWGITRQGDTLEITHGTLDGRMQTDHIEVEIGRGNNSTEEQAEKLMERKIEMKSRSGYGEDRENLKDPEINQLGFKKPMLAIKINPKKVYWQTACLQRKYNGHRCLVTAARPVPATSGLPTRKKPVSKPSCALLTAYGRGGITIKSISHIIPHLAGRLRAGETIDGELYKHGMPLQEISSLVTTRNRTAHELEYVVYDMMGNKPFIKRMERLKEICSGVENVTIAKTWMVESYGEVEKKVKKFVKKGYEGGIVRHGIKGYEPGTRTASLMKVKFPLDKEFIVINILKSVEGWARLVCGTKGGKEFRVSAPGTHKEKREVLHNKEKYIGKYVKVKFPEYTVDKIPSQPIAEMWRDKENE